jgi:hypothetical protein
LPMARVKGSSTGMGVMALVKGTRYTDKGTPMKGLFFLMPSTIFAVTSSVERSLVPLTGLAPANIPVATVFGQT